MLYSRFEVYISAGVKESRIAKSVPLGFLWWLEALLRFAPEMRCLGPDYRIVYWDSKAESLTGFLAEEAVGSQALLRGSARRT